MILPNVLKCNSKCVLFSVLMIFNQLAFAVTRGLLIDVDNLKVTKPLMAATIAGEALSGWKSNTVTVANSPGISNTLYLNLSAMSNAVGSYSEEGKNYMVFDIKDDSGVSSGVGFILRVSSYLCLFGGCWGSNGDIAVGNTELEISPTKDFDFAQVIYSVKLIATGAEIKSSYSVPDWQIGVLSFWGTQSANRVVVMRGFNINYTKTGCVASAYPSSINMGVVSVAQLTNSRSVAALLPVTVSLKCDSGIGVYASMTDLSDPGNSKENLTLIPSTNTAKGVAVRFLDENQNAISYGPPSAFVGSLNQWKVKSSSDPNEVSFKLYPQYVMTGTASDVTPGDANAMASITFAYE
ncbi:fimbrial protein [Pseudomonas sp. RC4D1]|uniref:fimbrial protein n=1 Tax=Pseudomonas sp. RC4D1 TaxID=2834407 RepID=UPI001BCC6CF3|nr:fimbrial protein [Pseudomonas sp. RC4D1]